jgi:hypothetical protein
MTAAYFEDHPTDPDKVIMRKPTMMWEGALHIVCQCDKCKAAPQRTWVDLSDEDIEECFTITPDLYLKRHIAQRILDKFKEKNNG